MKIPLHPIKSHENHHNVLVYLFFSIIKTRESPLTHQSPHPSPHPPGLPASPAASRDPSVPRSAPPVARRAPPAVPRSPTPCRTGDATSRRFPKGRVRSVMKRDANGPNVKDFTVHLNHFSTRRGCSQVFCVAPTDFVWERPSYCERTHYKRVPVQVLRSHPLW